MASSPSTSPSGSPSASPSRSPSLSPSTSPSRSPSLSPSTSISGTPSSPYYSEFTAIANNRVVRCGLNFFCVSSVYDDFDEVPQTGDIVHMVKIPKGATLLDVLLDMSDMDAGTDMLLSVGYTGALTAFISSSTVGQAGGIVRLSVPGGSQKLFAAEDTIQVEFTLAGATTTTGTMKLSAWYTMDP